MEQPLQRRRSGVGRSVDRRRRGAHFAQHQSVTRAAVNTVPEPFSNWALSFGEDMLAVWLTWFTPPIRSRTIVIVAALLVVCAILLHYLFRFARAALKTL